MYDKQYSDSKKKSKMIHTCVPVFILVMGALIRMAVKNTTSTST